MSAIGASSRTVPTTAFTASQSRSFQVPGSPSSHSIRRRYLEPRGPRPPAGSPARGADGRYAAAIGTPHQRADRRLVCFASQPRAQQRRGQDEQAAREADEHVRQVLAGLADVAAQRVPLPRDVIE